MRSNVKPYRPLVSIAVVIKPLKLLTLALFFLGAGLLILALCLSAFDVGDRVYYVVIALAVLIPLTSLGYFVAAIVGRVREEIPLEPSGLAVLGILCGSIVPVLMIAALSMGLGQNERGMAVFFWYAGFSAALSLLMLFFGVTAKITQAFEGPGTELSNPESSS